MHYSMLDLHTNTLVHLHFHFAPMCYWLIYVFGVWGWSSVIWGLGLGVILYGDKTKMGMKRFYLQTTIAGSKPTTYVSRRWPLFKVISVIQRHPKLTQASKQHQNVTKVYYFTTNRPKMKPQVWKSPIPYQPISTIMRVISILNLALLVHQIIWQYLNSSSWDIKDQLEQ